MILNTFEILPEYTHIFFDPLQALKAPVWLRLSALARSYEDSGVGLIAAANVQSHSHFLYKNETVHQVKLSSVWAFSDA